MNTLPERVLATRIQNFESNQQENLELQTQILRMIETHLGHEALKNVIVGPWKQK